MSFSKKIISQTYSGTFPCADCSGLHTTITLIRTNIHAKDGTYVMHELYEGKSTQPYVSEGNWTLTTGIPSNPHASLLTLNPGQSDVNFYVLNDMKNLQMLDSNKEQIDSPFNQTLTLVKKNKSTEPSTPAPKLANPASVNCTEKGGTNIMKQRGDGSEYGLCQFEDNRACEEWALYREECPVGGVKTTGYDTISQKYCAWVGGQTIADPNANCTLPNGNTCNNDALYNGTCN